MTLCEIRLYSGINIAQKSFVTDCSGLIPGQKQNDCITLPLQGYPFGLNFSSTLIEGGSNLDSAYGLKVETDGNGDVKYGGWIIFQLPERRNVQLVVIVGN
jgi:hypothetical protein